MHILSALKHLISFKMIKCHFFGGQSRDESFQNVNCFYMTQTTVISIKKSCYIVKSFTCFLTLLNVRLMHIDNII